jgi:hypothetical protein
VYTSRFTGGRNGLEYLLPWLGVRQKNGAARPPADRRARSSASTRPSKRWLGQQPAARTITELQAQLDAFRLAYDEHRPHRATGRVTPGEAYRATPRAQPAGRGAPGHFRLRYDIADTKGAISLRRAGRLYHLRIGAAHARRRVLAIVDEREVTVVALDTGEILSSHRIEPDKGYWRNPRRDPGRWPGSQATGGSQ